ncbi:acetyl-CoA carboxylase biotin carboxyl carrier protein [Rhizobium sp. SL42]|uniref:acetyl-CoA carboxylase biotin carboxyl carrier protein n=1 Tax=Rhizobium sp. SL42 TaxID=2806346 RepID=UPI001F2D8F00|nr:acetyl-CoA carboxylase biotin carboxyl carrier protein subunit [Rhizobium sp. SL42]UJW74220.1 biotin/lipoyl-binding protein [Rhizobium sp. SL42]
MDLDKIKALLEYVGRSRVAEMRVTQDGTTVVIRNAPASAGGSLAAAERDAASGASDHLVTAFEQKGLVRAPVSGIVHNAASPGAPALAQVGDRVEAGQGLCILEAMKVFTTVPAPADGVIMRVLFQDGQEVAAGDPLVEIA